MEHLQKLQKIIKLYQLYFLTRIKRLNIYEFYLINIDIKILKNINKSGSVIYTKHTIPLAN